MASASKGNNQDPTNGNRAEHDTIPDQMEEAKQFTWMVDSPQWGTKAVPSKRGLTLDVINTGFYGEVPSQSEEMTRMPRGARHVPGLPRLEFYSLSKKEEIWADNAGTL